ncbi:CPBP family intramembrane glutamic endopeptidase [Laceyella putida]|uniref:CPBP family intramembrane glutamic endopeptidase n=1 Tax=Laceyella putida TaxID=110101 RepID=A0ABW2RMA9_9BACL
MNENHNGIEDKWQNKQARLILISFYFTQMIFILLSVSFLWWKGQLYAEVIPFADAHMWLIGICAGGLIVALEFVLIRYVPQHHFDDGGINQLLFARRSWWHILFIAIVAAIGEELLFRGVVQAWVGVWGTTLLFVLVHTRYLKKWVLVAFVAAVSLLFGYIVEWTHHLAPAIIAHASVDFIMGCYLRYAVKA